MHAQQGWHWPRGLSYAPIELPSPSHTNYDCFIIYNLRFMNYELRFTIHDIRFAFTIYESRFTINESRFMNYDL